MCWEVAHVALYVSVDTGAGVDWSHDCWVVNVWVPCFVMVLQDMHGGTSCE